MSLLLPFLPTRMMENQQGQALYYLLLSSFLQHYLMSGITMFLLSTELLHLLWLFPIFDPILTSFKYTPHFFNLIWSGPCICPSSPLLPFAPALSHFPNLVGIPLGDGRTERRVSWFLASRSATPLQCDDEKFIWATLVCLAHCCQPPNLEHGRYPTTVFWINE